MTIQGQERVNELAQTLWRMEKMMAEEREIRFGIEKRLKQVEEHVKMSDNPDLQR
jgi:hypothetical protein